MPRNEAVLPEPDIFSTDTLEILSDAGAWLLTRRGAYLGRNSLMDSSTGATAVMRPSSNGMFWRRALSVVNSHVGNGFVAPGWPVGNNYASTPVSAQLPLEWRFQLLVARTGPLTAGVPGFFGIIGNSFSTPVSSAFPLYGLHSLSTENGGAWTVYLRSRKAGAIVTTNLGIDPTTQHLLELIYRDTSAPQIQLAVDGVVVDTVTGIANVPQQDMNENNWCVGFTNGRLAGGASGQADYYRRARLIIQELPGYE